MPVRPQATWKDWKMIPGCKNNERWEMGMKSFDKLGNIVDKDCTSSTTVVAARNGSGQSLMSSCFQICSRPTETALDLLYPRAIMFPQ